MKTRGSSPFIAGDLSFADLYLAPLAFYVSLTPDKDAVFDVDGFAEWWANIQALPSFVKTQPKLGVGSDPRDERGDLPKSGSPTLQSMGTQAQVGGRGRS